MSSRHPIETLYDRLINTFENTSEISQARLSSYSDTQLSRYVKIETGAFRTPYSDHSTKEIVLNRRFLCLMWCITYVLIEITQNKSRTAIKITETYLVMDKEDSEVLQLDYLFDWAYSLKTEGSSGNWPDALPSPINTNNKARVTNVIFIDAINYIMFHEVAHIVNGHWNNYKDIDSKFKNGDILNDDEKSSCVQMEQEADMFAYDCLVGSQNDEVIRYHKHLGIIIAGLSSLFAIKKGAKLFSLTHPSVHVRLFNSLQHTLFDEEYEFHLNRVMNVGISMFCKLQRIEFEDKQFRTFEELLNYFFELLESNGNSVLQQ